MEIVSEPVRVHAGAKAGHLHLQTRAQGIKTLITLDADKFIRASSDRCLGDFAFSCLKSAQCFRDRYRQLYADNFVARCFRWLNISLPVLRCEIRVIDDD